MKKVYYDSICSLLTEAIKCSTFALMKVFMYRRPEKDGECYKNSEWNDCGFRS